MSTSKLIDKIVKDSKEQEKVILEKANVEVERISSDVDKKIETMISKSKEKAQAEGGLKKEREIQSAILQVRNNKLSAKQEIISRVLDKALDKLNNLSTEEFVEFLKNTLVSNDFTGNGEIIVNSNRYSAITEEVVSHLNSELNIHLTVGSKGNDTKDGFLIKQGNVYCNFTFEAILESLRNELVSEVSRKLF